MRTVPNVIKNFSAFSIASESGQVIDVEGCAIEFLVSIKEFKYVSDCLRTEDISFDPQNNWNFDCWASLSHKFLTPALLKRSDSTSGLIFSEVIDKHL